MAATVKALCKVLFTMTLPVLGDGGDSGQNDSSNSVLLDLIVEGLLVAEDPYEIFKDFKIIGHGGTAEVYKAIKLSDGHAYAIKKFRPDTPLVDIANELRTLKRCAHKHINGYQEAYVSDNKVYLVLAFCIGSITDILQLFKEPLKEQEIAVICNHTLQGLSHLHDKCKIVHRDIKANNILLSPSGLAMIGDFGISKALSNDEQANTFIGSPYWMAPEVILAMETGTYSYAVDVWSLGITLIELAEKTPPLFHMHGMSACYHIANNDPPVLSEDSQWSASFRDFLSHCLVREPEKRWTPQQLLGHHFVVDAGGNEGKDVIKSLIRRCRHIKAASKSRNYSESFQLGLINRKEDGGGNSGTTAPSDEANGTPTTSEITNDAISEVASSPARGNKNDASLVRGSASLGSTPVTSPTKDGGRNAMRDETIKSPVQLAREEEAVLDRGRLELKLQMKEISKLRQKHTEELKKSEDKQQGEQEGIMKAQETQMLALKRINQQAVKEFEKENGQELARLTRSHVIARKKVEELLKKTWQANFKEYKASIKLELQNLKKTHKELKETKKSISEATDSVRQRRLMEFTDLERKCFTLENAALNATHQIFDIRHKIGALKKEFELRERNLASECDLMEKHKIGPICDLRRAHLGALQLKRSEQQSERHMFIEKQLEERHISDQRQVQKAQRTRSKRLTSTLKKLSTTDERVLAVVERRRQMGAGKSGSLPSLDKIEHDTPGSPSFSKKRSLTKEARRELKAAREEHIKTETIKLNDDHIKAMEGTVQQHAQELALLKEQHRMERDMFAGARVKELEAYDKDVENLKKSTAQFIAMQKKNFLGLKKDKMKKPLKKYSDMLDVQRRLLQSTLADLRELYAEMPGRASVRPASLDTLVAPLHAPNA